MRYISNVTTLEFFSEKCTGCGVCVQVCPHGVFEMNEKKAVLIDSDMCMECGACENNCAFDAIRVNSGVGCASAIINSMRSGGEPSCGCSESETRSSCC